MWTLKFDKDGKIGHDTLPPLDEFFGGYRACAGFEASVSRLAQVTPA